MSAAARFQSERSAPLPPSRQVEPTVPPRLGPGGPNMPSVLDRSASHRVPSGQSKSKLLDRETTTRAPAKPSPPQAVPMGKSKSLGRQPTGGKAQNDAIPRRRDKGKENEEVIRQLRAICSSGDPNQIYRSLTKIGQGYVMSAEKFS
jgi:p21-activated kinase 1